MRGILYPILLLAATTIGIDYSAATGDEEKITWRDIEPGFMFQEEDCASGDTVGYVVGNFAGNGVDTLYCIAVGSVHNPRPGNGEENVLNPHLDIYRFSNAEAGYNDLYLVDSPWLDNVKVSDLDHDGKDEMQMLQNCNYSQMLGYKAYDYDNGKWVLLTEPVTFRLDVRNDDDAFVYEPSDEPGKVVVYEDEMTDMETLDYETVRKVIPIDRQPLTYPVNTGYTWPDGKPLKLPLKVTRN